MSTADAAPVAPSKLESALDAPLVATGAEIPDASYGGTLFEFGEPFELDATKSKFYKKGQPPTKIVFEASFGIYDANGQPARLDLLCAFPDGGLTGSKVNKRSNVYKMLASLAAGSDLIDKNGNFAKGTTLRKFIGTKGVLAVKKNSADWPAIEKVGPFMEGAKYPTLEECKAIPATEKGRGDSDVPF